MRSGGHSVAGRTPGVVRSKWRSVNNKQASNLYTQLATMDIIAAYMEHVKFRQLGYIFDRKADSQLLDLGGFHNSSLDVHFSVVVV